MEIVWAANIRLMPSVAAAEATYIAKIDDRVVSKGILEQDGAHEFSN
jgi:hypothetical protein